MTDNEEMFKRWQEFCWAEGVYTHWAGFFAAVIGQSKRAEALCALGMQMVRSEDPHGMGYREKFDEIVAQTRDSGKA